MAVVPLCALELLQQWLGDSRCCLRVLGLIALRAAAGHCMSLAHVCRSNRRVMLERQGWRIASAAHAVAASYWQRSGSRLSMRAHELIEEHSAVPADLPLLHRLRILLAGSAEDSRVLYLLAQRRPSLRGWLARTAVQVQRELQLQELLDDAENDVC